jgi:putative oxidoreductase
MSMDKASDMASVSAAKNAAAGTRAANFERFGILYARIALGAAFLSGIADRFGLYWGRNVGYGNFDGFVRYTAQVNSFMPAATIPFLAWAATAAELFFGIALIIGIWPRWVALGSAALLVLFGVAMGISFGIKSPLDYSVFSASACAVLLAVYSGRKPAA